MVAAGLLASAAVVAMPVGARPATASAADPLAGLSINVPAKKFVLKNGLTLIVHEEVGVTD